MQEITPRRSLPAQIVGALGGWLKGQLQITAILTVLYTMGFAVFHVPVWYLLGPFCGLMYLIPLFGAPIGLILVLGASFFSSRPMGYILGALAVWVAIEAFEGFYLTPHILGKRTQLAPFVVFLGVVFASAIFGPLGVLLAVPVMSVVLVVYRYFAVPR